jgi:hypothetical protein
MQINAKRLSELIEQELANVSDTRIVRHIRGLLVIPKIEFRDWDYCSPGQQYPCWIVLSDAENSNTAIGYCEYGFGPRCPWGLLYCGDDPKHQSMGMDTGWFPTFLEAFFGSFAAVPLPVWRVFRVADDGIPTPLTDEGTWEATCERTLELRSADPTNIYYCGQSITAAR